SHHLALVFHSPGDHRDLHSFPTRRSSDLRSPVAVTTTAPAAAASAVRWSAGSSEASARAASLIGGSGVAPSDRGRRTGGRSCAPPGYERRWATNVLARWFHLHSGHTSTT